ncbi:MAG: hypothetical protein ACRCWF_08685 [Beijerinckiaceae bacterium]
MLSQSFRFAFATTALLFISTPVLAQSQTAYQDGISIAQRRGVSDTACYARVFAKFATLEKGKDGSRNWSVTVTPAYNEALRSQCKVDRVALTRQQDLRVHNSSTGHNSAGAYSAGLEAGRRFGYKNPECYARVFARHAYPMASEGKRGTWYEYDPNSAFLGELRRECNV